MNRDFDEFRDAFKIRDRICELMGWPPGVSHESQVVQKVMTGQAVAISVVRLGWIADEIQALRKMVADAEQVRDQRWEIAKKYRTQALRLEVEVDAWKRLVHDAEQAIGMDSRAITPEARSLVEWCDEAKAVRERLETESWKEHAGDHS